MTTHHPTEQSLRDALRHQTAKTHELLDQALSRLDLRDSTQRQEFCAIQAHGFHLMGQACNWQAAEATPILRRAIDALEQDISPARRAMTVYPPHPIPGLTLQPDAVAYLVLGSQLGATVLRRALPEDQQTGFFGLRAETTLWRQFCQRLADQPADTPHARRVISDARTAFGLFDVTNASETTVDAAIASQ